MGSSIAHKRREAAYFRAVAQVLTEELTNVNISYPTVTGVKLSNDGSHLKVFLRFERNIESSLETLNKAKVKGFVRSRISSAIKQRKAPAIHFEYDETFENGQRIDEILKKIHDKEK